MRKGRLFRAARFNRIEVSLVSASATDANRNEAGRRSRHGEKKHDG